VSGIFLVRRRSGSTMMGGRESTVNCILFMSLHALHSGFCVINHFVYLDIPSFSLTMYVVAS